MESSLACRARPIWRRRVDCSLGVGCPLLRRPVLAAGKSFVAWNLPAFWTLPWLEYRGRCPRSPSQCYGDVSLLPDQLPLGLVPNILRCPHS